MNEFKIPAGWENLNEVAAQRLEYIRITSSTINFPMILFRKIGDPDYMIILTKGSQLWFVPSNDKGKGTYHVEKSARARLIKTKTGLTFVKKKVKDAGESTSFEYEPELQGAQTGIIIDVKNYVRCSKRYRFSEEEA